MSQLQFSTDAAQTATQNFSSPVAPKVASRTAAQEKQHDAAQQPEVLAAGLWLRVVLGFEAPFGFDGMPTVWD